MGAIQLNTILAGGVHMLCIHPLLVVLFCVLTFRLMNLRLLALFVIVFM